MTATETATVIEQADRLLGALLTCHCHSIGVLYERYELDTPELAAARAAWSSVWQAVGGLAFALQTLDGRPRPLPQAPS